MRSMLKILLSGIGVLSLVGLAASLILDKTNVLRAYVDVFAGVCTSVVGVPGVEDIASDPANDIAWLSSFDRTAARTGSQVRGAIIAFDTSNPLDDRSWRDRTKGKPHAFEPLGIDLYSDEKSRRLFAINRAKNNVVIYDISNNGELSFVRELHDDRLTSPVNIAAVGPEEFYVTNASSGRGANFTADLAFLAGMGSGSVLYYDGNSWSNAVSNLKGANGIEVSANGLLIYIAETSGKSVSVYDRDLATGTLTLREQIMLDVFPDNLNRLANGDVFVGAVPKPLSFIRHANGKSATSPSQVLKLQLGADPLTGGVDTASLVYQNDGTELSGATVAAMVDEKLLIGAYAENKFLLCE